MAGHPIEGRRRLIACILLALAVLGALMRAWTDPESIAHDVGTLLLVMWVPVVGNIVGYFMKKWAPRPRGPAVFAADAPFVVHARVDIAFDAAAPDLHVPWPCALLQGTKAYTVRLWADTPDAPDACASEPAGRTAVGLQFLAPDVAGRHFAAGAEFRIVSHATVVGSGRVINVIG